MVHSLGCAKNLVDAEEVLGGLIDTGWRAVDTADEADLIVVNTCGFIESAVEESVQAVLEAGLKARRTGAKLVVMGCLVQRYGKKLARSVPEAALFLGPGEFHRLPGLLGRDLTGEVHIGRPRYLRDAAAPRMVSTPGGWAWVKVAEGCSRACTFCLIPRLRGAMRSRPIDDVGAEVRGLVEGGVKEVSLVAQDLTSFGRDNGQDLAGLIAGLDEIEGLVWVRLLYLHPDGFGDGLLEAVARSTKTLPYFDLPLQHVDPGILRAMGRSKGPDELRRMLESIRRRIPKAVLRTTLMVGFPGEGEAEFERLARLVEEVEFDHLGVFTFSPEAGVRAARLSGAIDPLVADERRDALMALQADISRRRLSVHVGRELLTLAEGPHPESDLLLCGRPWFFAPEVDGTLIITDGRATPGEMVTVKVTKSHDFDLEGEIVEHS